MERGWTAKPGPRGPHRRNFVSGAPFGERPRNRGRDPRPYQFRQRQLVGHGYSPDLSAALGRRAAEHLYRWSLLTRPRELHTRSTPITESDDTAHADQVPMAE